VLATAAAHPDRLVLGIDPVAAAMAESSRRAALPARRGGLPNAVFVVAAAEALPPELCGAAACLTVNLPWGSLLRGALALDRGAASGIAALSAPGGRVELLLAPAERDRLAGDVDVRARVAGSLAADWRALGLELVDAGPATAHDLASRRTTWGRRLALERGAGRESWLIVLRRRGGTAIPPDITPHACPRPQRPIPRARHDPAVMPEAQNGIGHRSA
jgi:16S rRNA (adenine(1408)-N(1))-methyltransferase